MKSGANNLQPNLNPHAEAQRRKGLSQFHSLTSSLRLRASAPLRQNDRVRLRFRHLLILSSLLLLLANAHSPAQDGAATIRACPRCGWKPPVTKWGVRVSTIAELEQAVASAPASTTVLVQDGTYHLTRQLHFEKPDVVLRSESGNREKVILRGDGMQERKVGVGVSIGADNIVVADLTITNVGFHGVQVRGESGVKNAVLHNIAVKDTGQQLVKGSIGDGSKHSENGLVACSSFSYTDHAPSDYTNGVDILGGRDWVVRDNEFRRIRGRADQGYRCGPTILFWRDCRDSLVTRNVLIDCYRGIAVGLIPSESKDTAGQSGFDHHRGLVCNNVVCNLNAWADEALEANAAKDVRIEHNTVLVESGNSPWSIGVRFRGTTASIRNNLTNRDIIERDGGRLTAEGNVTTAARDWFVDPDAGNLRLANAQTKAAKAGVPLSPGDSNRELARDAAGRAGRMSSLLEGRPGNLRRVCRPHSPALMAIWIIAPTKRGRR
jgi:hypothetical protein